MLKADNAFDDACDHRMIDYQHFEHKKADKICPDLFAIHYYDGDFHNHIPIRLFTMTSEHIV
jgi:hypothetical protein